MKADESHTADQNLFIIGNNPYPGRGIVIGNDQTGNYMVQVYWLMGRSPDSQNRILVDKHLGCVATEAIDSSKVKDPSLTIYNAMKQQSGLFVVSNGHHTDTVIAESTKNNHSLKKGPLQAAMEQWSYEPDDNHTPRIAGVCSLYNPTRFQLAVIKQAGCGDDSIRHYFEASTIRNGFGYCIHTYMGNSNPLPSWKGEPLLVPLRGTSKDIANMYWRKLNKEYRVALVVKYIEIKTGQSTLYIINEYFNQNPGFS